MHTAHHDTRIVMACILFAHMTLPTVVVWSFTLSSAVILSWDIIVDSKALDIGSVISKSTHSGIVFPLYEGRDIVQCFETNCRIVFTADSLFYKNVYAYGVYTLSCMLVHIKGTLHILDVQKIVRIEHRYASSIYSGMYLNGRKWCVLFKNKKTTVYRKTTTHFWPMC